MVPDKFNMVDMDGIDLIMAQGEEVPGLYNRLVESIAQCRYQCLYNWFFDGVVIPPSYVELEVGENEEVLINDGVTVTTDDVIHIYSTEPGPVDPEIIPLLAEENGTYTVPAGKDGFNPVTVDVPSYTPVINPISITENGTYNAPSGVDGYSPIIVNVSSGEDWLSLKNYIESSGTQYINTGYSPTANTKFEVIADVPDNSTSYPALIGERTTSSNGVQLFPEYAGNYISMIWGNGDRALSVPYNNRFWIGKKSKYVMGADGAVKLFNVDGIGFSYNIPIGAFSNLSLYIFALNENGNPNSVTWCSAKLYRFRIYENDVLVHEFIPWQDNGVACLKDAVTENLFYNAGTGTFVYGTDQ